MEEEEDDVDEDFDGIFPMRNEGVCIQEDKNALDVPSSESRLDKNENSDACGLQLI